MSNLCKTLYYVFNIAATIESASASNAWSCRCSVVRAAARCALFAAALASRSALSFPYMPTCASTCLILKEMLACVRAVNARRKTCQRSAFSSRRPNLVHPSASQRAIHFVTPSTQSWLSVKTTRQRNSAGHAIALRIARMMAVISARLLVCRPRRMALTFKSDFSPNQTPQPARQRPCLTSADPSVYAWISPSGTSPGAGLRVSGRPVSCRRRVSRCSDLASARLARRGDLRLRTEPSLC